MSDENQNPPGAPPSPPGTPVNPPTPERSLSAPPPGSPVGAHMGTIAPTHAVIPAGFWRRFAALLIDGIIVSFVTLPVNFVISFLVGFTTVSSMQSGMYDPGMGTFALNFVLQLISMAIYFVAAFFYYGYFYKNKGASPGKLVLQLKVVDVNNGQYLSYGRTFFRETIGKLLNSLTLCVGWILCIVRSDKRGLHDLLVGSQVVLQKNAEGN